MAMWYVFSSVLVWTEIISAFVLRPLSGQRRFLLYNTISVNTHVRVDQGSEVLPESDMFRLLDCVSRRRSCHSTNHSWQHCLALGGGSRRGLHLWTLLWGDSSWLFLPGLSSTVQNSHLRPRWLMDSVIDFEVVSNNLPWLISFSALVEVKFRLARLSSSCPGGVCGWFWSRLNETPYLQVSQDVPTTSKSGILASARAGWSEVNKQTGSGLIVTNLGIAFRSQASRGDSEGVCCSIERAQSGGVLT